MRKALFLPVILTLVACGTVTPKPVSPCPGWYCIEVDGIPGLPGAPSLCYASLASRNEAMLELTKSGHKVTKVY